MKQTIKYFSTLLIIFSCINVWAQDVPIGNWKDYLSYNNGITVTMGTVNNQNIVYCTASSAIFSYNISDNSIEKLSRVTGLSDVDPSVARFSQSNNTLVIGYPDGNIDLLQGNNIVNIPDLKNASVQGSKSINCISFNGIYAYVGCGQGIMQIDLTQDVIESLFTFGQNGATIDVRSIAITNDDTIFAGTRYGVYFASLNDANLQYYADWNLVPYSTCAWGIYNAATTVGDSVYVNWSSGETTGGYSNNKDTTYIYYNGHWSHFAPVMGNNGVNSYESRFINGQNILIASTVYTIATYNASGNSPIPQFGSYVINGSLVGVSANDAIIDGAGNFWVADAKLGLVEAVQPYYVGTVLTPAGPYNNQSFTIATNSNAICTSTVNGNNLWIVAGGYDANGTGVFDNAGLSTDQNQTWSYIPSPSGILDLNCLAIDPFNPLHVFAGSWGGGLVEYNNNNVVNVYTSSNSPIQSVSGAPGDNRVGGVAFDTLGNLWATCALTTSKYLVVKEANGKWDSIDFGKNLTILQPAAYVTQVLVTQSQAKWLLFGGTGIVAYQDNGTFATPNSGNTQLITTKKGSGGLPDLNINCMAEDQNGSIWVGTDVQVMVFYSPDNVFDGLGDWDAQPVYVTQTGYTQYLMQNQNTTCITIDGANRKWIGTQGGGVFLMSADGTQQIYNFTASNSPLLSNNIQQIAINPNNGEVFFATDKGVVSFRGTATEGLNTYGNVYAFPNPVKHDYSGPIAIKNLVTNSDVKITTVSGELVYHTVALGGQAIWNGNNFDGKRVDTGVYLVFCTSPDGSQNLISKLLFIN